MTELQTFYSLTPDQVLLAVEQSGRRTTGLCYALNSLENRVYEVELEDGERVVGKFYRPGRWSRQTILDEHRLLGTLVAEEIPACAPIEFDDGGTLRTTEDAIFFALFPRMGGRAPDELSLEELEQLGRLLGRIHNVSAALALRHRPLLSPATYGTECLETILTHAELSPGVRERYVTAVERLVALGEHAFASVETFVGHADFHRGNLLRHPNLGWLILDFDDAASAPAVQDLWLVLPARPQDCPEEVESLLKGYEQFRDIERQTLGLVELLRGLRYVRYAAWVARRWDDPAFPRAFPHFGTDNYWEGQVADLYDQIRLVEQSRWGS